MNRTQSEASSGAHETYGYDYANRQTSYVKQVGGPTTVSYTYAYTPSGERLKKVNVLANTAEWYMSDGPDVATDYTQAGAGSLTLATSYVQALSIDSKVARIRASDGAEHYYVPDALGSVTHVMSSAQLIGVLPVGPRRQGAGGA